MAAVAELADAAIPLEAAVAQLFVPPVAARLAARKRAAGLYDFDDMLTLVNEALNGPRGAELTATLRQRYRLAIVDEFQDTDQIQWEIFRTLFDDRASRPALSGRRSEAGDLRISRRRRGDLRRGPRDRGGG